MSEPAAYPHCDSSVLHAPGECEFCDHYPDWQAYRSSARINFTGHTDPDKAPCPSTHFRPLETIEQWGLNRAYPPKPPVRPTSQNSRTLRILKQALKRERPSVAPVQGHLTTDRSDPRLGHGVDATPIPQHDAYLVLSEEERAKGFVRPVRRSYRHVGIAGPRYPLRDLDERQRELFGDVYAKFEEYREGGAATGRYWTQQELANIGQGCGTVTRMGQALAETYAREPKFYGATYCVPCSMHLPVAEFVWDGTDERVGS